MTICVYNNCFIFQNSIILISMQETMISCYGEPPTDPCGGPRSSQAQERKCHTFVQAMNRFSCQKAGGQFEPPAFNKLPYCILCKVGTCLGPSCLGQENKKPPKSNEYLTKIVQHLVIHLHLFDLILSVVG